MFWKINTGMKILIITQGLVLNDLTLNSKNINIGKNFMSDKKEFICL